MILAAAMICCVGCGNAAFRRTVPDISIRLPRSGSSPQPTAEVTPGAGILTPIITPTPSTGVTPGGSGQGHLINRMGYTAMQISEYFDEVALNAEYGGSDHRVHKWNSPIVLYVKGVPTSQDRLVLQSILLKMNSTYGFPGIRETAKESEANLVITFADDNEYTELTPANINDLTDGFATCWWQNSVIYKADIGIRRSISQSERNSVIWEEMVQATGLQNDSYRYPTSLFYQGYNEVQEPTPLDWILFQILYHPDMLAGTSREEAILLSISLLE